MPVSNSPEKGKQYEATKAPEPGNSTLEVEASHLIVCKHTMPSSKDGEERYVTLQRLSDSQLQLEVYRQLGRRSAGGWYHGGQPAWCHLTTTYLTFSHNAETTCLILLLSGGIKWMGGIIEQVREAHHLAPILLSNSICVRYFFLVNFLFLSSTFLRTFKSLFCFSRLKTFMLPLVQALVIRWRHLLWFQSWPPGCITALPHCLELSCWHYQLVFSWYLHQPESHQLSLNKVL